MRDNSQHIVVGTATLPPGFSTRAHSHPPRRSRWCCEAAAGWTSTGSRIRIRPGTVLVTPADLVHVTHSDPGDEPLVVLWFYAPPGAEARWVEPDKHDTAGPAGPSDPSRPVTGDARLAGGHRHRWHVHRPGRRPRRGAAHRQGALDAARLRAGRARLHPRGGHRGGRHRAAWRTARPWPPTPSSSAAARRPRC